MLPAYLEVLKDVDPEGTFVLDKSARQDGNKFRRIFLSPSTSKAALSGCMRVAACDGTFTKSKFTQTHGNNNTILLAWGVVENENEDSWRFFMEHLKM
jgi:hypothetical protein